MLKEEEEEETFNHRKHLRILICKGENLKSIEHLRRNWSQIC